ncbi:MAG: VOC family protein [Pseudomonas sp.]|uniref:VOC family protein n=1 Tax=unclassified Pseudomonas TaxID=196821 RepID=UPI001CFAC853|nr:VOC family protein [Pseudomonas sp. L5B5]UCZ84381.1 glyoxalase/bleomycin resistance/dioxygenase family protein [Pseudomonas sp. L5B5]
MPDSPIIAVMIHAADWRAATTWYAQAFPDARRIVHEPDDFGHLQLAGLSLEIVPCDAKVDQGPAGSVVYWRVQDLPAEVRRLSALGGRLYRGPMAIEGGEWICQVQDPWGNCIGLRQPAPLA